MEQYVFLAGPTLDQAMGLIRLGRIKAQPSDNIAFEQGKCVGTKRSIEAARARATGDLQALLTATAGTPVHVYVAHEPESHKCGGVRHHVCRMQPLPGSFMTIGEGVAVPSWELYFLLRCRKEPQLSKRLMLGMELCGTYTHASPGNERTATYYRQASVTKDGKLVARWNDPPVQLATTAERLGAWLQLARGAWGARYAIEAARYLKDGSASPFETIFAIVATLPCRLGGYGFAAAKLNPKITVTPEKRHLTQTDAYHPDCYLEEMEIDLEVESRERHSGAAAVERGATTSRRWALRSWM